MSSVAILLLAAVAVVVVAGLDTTTHLRACFLFPSRRADTVFPALRYHPRARETGSAIYISVVMNLIKGSKRRREERKEGGGRKKSESPREAASHDASSAERR